MKKDRRKLFVFATIVAAFVVITGSVYTNFNAIQITPKSSDSYGLRVDNSSGTAKFTVDVDGTTSTNGSLDINGGTVQSWGTVGAATTATLTDTSSDYQLINKTVGLASLTVALPTITAANSGKIFIFKQLDSGTTDCNVTPTAGVDAIETAQGTLSGVSDYVLDAIGDCKGWKAYYNSGASSVWLLIHDDVT